MSLVSKRPVFARCGMTLLFSVAFTLASYNLEAETKGTAASAPPAATALSRPAATFDSFRIVTERNIFNPNRVGRTRSSRDEPQPRFDVAGLVGVMDSTSGLYAFFDSPDTNYRKAVHENETIAVYTVRRISNAGVELERDGKRFTLKVGQQLRRPEGGDWAPTEGDPVASQTTLTPQASSASAVPADASDTLRRLMEQRQKQLQQ